MLSTRKIILLTHFVLSSTLTNKKERGQRKFPLSHNPEVAGSSPVPTKQEG